MIGRTIKLLRVMYAAIMLVFFFSLSATAFEGKVVSVADGDTLTVLSGKTQYKVRLSQIDAPEKNQPWGNRSRQSLIAFAAGKDVFVEVSGKDRYGRIIGSVLVNGVCAGEYQIKNGMAWVYDQFVTDYSIYDIQSLARTKRVGLWSEPEPVAPWLWRKSMTKEKKEL